MARQEKNSVDYFPYICKEGKAMFYIETKYQNDGFATWIKILRQLAVTNYHYLDLSNKVDLMFLAAKCRVSETVLDSIISDLVDLGEFDKMLWVENKVIWCQKLVDSIDDAYKKRNNKCITYEGLLTLLVALGSRKLTKSSPKGAGNTQSIVKDSIVDKSIVKDTKEEVVFPFHSDEFLSMWDNWKAYKKKEYKFSFKSEISEQAALNVLSKMSGGHEEKAIKIILQSIENGWKGFFELKNETNGTGTTKNNSANNYGYTPEGINDIIHN